MTSPAPKAPITVAQYYQMVIDGFLHEDDPVELIDGELHWKTRASPPHAATGRRLIRIFVCQLDKQAVVGPHNPIHLDDYSEPAPDVYLARWQPDYYRAGHPTPADLLLLVEVADTTLREDQRVKAPLYARFGIPEYWIVNLPQNVIEIYTDPQDGQYRRHVLYRRGEQIAPQAFPDLLIAVASILG